MVIIKNLNIKKIIARPKLKLIGGTAKPGPLINPILAPYSLNLLELCKEINEKTKHFLGELFIEILIYKDKTFFISVKPPTLSFLFNGLKSLLNLARTLSFQVLVKFLYLIFFFKYNLNFDMIKNKDLSFFKKEFKSLFSFLKSGRYKILK